MTSPANSSVLYIDDEASNLTVFRAAYDERYDITTAASAREAMDVLRKQSVKVIVTDQRLPQMTGVQFLEAVAPTHPDVVKIILTGFTDIEAIVRAINTGRVHQYVTKPFDVDALRVVLDRAIELQEMQLRNRELVAQLEKAAARARATREAFQRHVPATVVAELLASGARSGIMTGDLRVVAVMFCRLHGFQRLCVGAGPADLVGFLGAYLQLINGAVMGNGGFVSEIINDEVIAVFGAPVSSLENEQNAVHAARQILRDLPMFNERFALPLFQAPVVLGIGVHRGEVIAGNIGSVPRMKYGVVGDTVNVASRLQDQTSQERSEIVISESVKEWLEADVPIEAIGETQLRGHSRRVGLYRVQP